MSQYVLPFSCAIKVVFANFPEMPSRYSLLRLLGSVWEGTGYLVLFPELHSFTDQDPFTRYLVRPQVEKWTLLSRPSWYHLRG